MDRPRQYSGLTKLGFGVLACNSGIAVYNSWGDAGSVGFVLTADGALLLLFLCLTELEQRRGGRGGDRMAMGGQYTALAKVGLAMVTCNTALDTYGARRHPGSAAFVLVSYAVLVSLTGHFVGAFAHAHGGEQGQD